MKTLSLRKTFVNEDGEYVATYRFVKSSLGEFYAVSNSGKRIDYANEDLFESSIASFKSAGWSVRKTPAVVRKAKAEAVAS